ncbi:hypothetical protein P167DRAFT_545621 [Morchella conica CCBAS932]|uniref:Uncharacterized protein n=1 Tax=Morchella conica CCBAS932 TaxID=1392247 RepID=A0A3N4KPG8_9PEZI|nr:hypothetical protein P167DRAFT_545621 [Morchella conica CCBAS932]
MVRNGNATRRRTAAGDTAAAGENPTGSSSGLDLTFGCSTPSACPLRPIGRGGWYPSGHRQRTPPPQPGVFEAKWAKTAPYHMLKHHGIDLMVKVTPIATPDWLICNIEFLGCRLTCAHGEKPSGLVAFFGTPGKGSHTFTQVAMAGQHDVEKETGDCSQPSSITVRDAIDTSGNGGPPYCSRTGVDEGSYARGVLRPYFVFGVEGYWVQPC